MTTYALHPYALLFPPMTESEYIALRESIREHGQRDAIVLWGDLDNQDIPNAQCPVLDGRNRLRACEELGIVPRTIRRFLSEADALQYVLDANLNRRHLTDGQRAAIAAEIATLKKGGQEANPPIGGFSQAEAAEKMNVSVRSTQRAAMVKEENDALHALIKEGKLSASLAEQVAKLTPEQQEGFLDKVEVGAKPAEVFAALKRETQSAEMVSALLDVAPEVPPHASQLGETPEEGEADLADDILKEGEPRRTLYEMLAGQKDAADDDATEPAEKPEPVRSPYYPFANMDERNTYVNTIFEGVHRELIAAAGSIPVGFAPSQRLQELGFVRWWTALLQTQYCYLKALEAEADKLEACWRCSGKGEYVNVPSNGVEGAAFTNTPRSCKDCNGTGKRWLDAQSTHLLKMLAERKNISLSECLKLLIEQKAGQVGIEIEGVAA